MKNIVKKILAALLLCVIMLSLCSCGKKEEEEIDTTGVADGVLTVAMECANAPYNWAQTDDSNGAVPIKGSALYANGYDVMMAKAICEKNGWKLEVVQLDWDSLIPALMAGSVDAIIAAQSMTSERQKQIDFSIPYMYANVVALTLKDSPYANAKGLKDLAGATCTSQSGTTWYDSCLPQVTGADIKMPAETSPAMLMALETGQVDFVVTDIPIAEGAVIAYPDMVILDFTKSDDDFDVPEEEVNLGISVQKGNTFLKEKIDAYLQGKTAEDYNALMREAIKVQPMSDED